VKQNYNYFFTGFDDSFFHDFQDFLEADGYSPISAKATPLFNRKTPHKQLVLVKSVIVSLVFVIVPVLYIWIMVLRFQHDRNTKFNPEKYNKL
jgi:hypothetical protein